MKSKRMESDSNRSNGVTEDSNGVKSSGSAMHGDVVWVRIRGNLWWPAQVADAKWVSSNSKPKKKFSNEVLVRLYGTYTYLYKDLVTSSSEFEKVLEQNNGSYRETFRKALEKDLSNNKPTPLKSDVSEPKEEAAEKTPKDKKAKITETPQDTKASEQKLEFTGTVSGRRVKVMQSLGLAAPLGSPFAKSLA